jgi:hypothetical protein
MSTTVLTMQRAMKILDALNVRLHTKVEIPYPFTLQTPPDAARPTPETSGPARR